MIGTSVALMGAGALAGGLGSMLGKKNSKPKTETYPTMDPWQRARYMSTLDWLGGRVGQGVANYGYGPWTPWAQEAYKRYRKPAEREFSERIIPALREQWAGAGALYGGRRYQAEQDAGVRLAEHLGAKRFEFERQAFQDYLRTVPEANPALQMLLAALSIPTFGTMGYQEGPSPMAGALMGMGGNLGQAGSSGLASALLGGGSGVGAPTNWGLSGQPINFAGFGG